jgi:hypothetical protein
MVLANSRFDIDVTEQRPRPLIPTPIRHLRQSARRQNHITIPQARDSFDGMLGRDIGAALPRASPV